MWFLQARSSPCWLPDWLIAASTRGVAGVLAYGAVQHPTTVFRQIQSLAPGVIHTIQVPAQSNWALLKTQTSTFWAVPARH